MGPDIFVFNHIQQNAYGISGSRCTALKEITQKIKKEIIFCVFWFSIKTMVRIALKKI